jgi:hypothetical protein
MSFFENFKFYDMGEEEDTLQLINKISDVLSMLLELKNQGRYQKGIDLVDDTLTRYFDFTNTSTNSISEKFLDEVYENSEKITPELINSMGDLFNEKGELLYSQNKLRESRDILKNALTIYFFLNDQQDFFSFQRMNKMVMINDKLSDIDLKISR